MVADEDDYEKISSDESDFEADEGDKQQQSEFPFICVSYPSFFLALCICLRHDNLFIPPPPAAPTGTVKL